MKDPNSPDAEMKKQTTLTNPPVAQQRLVKVKVLRPIRHKGTIYDPAILGQPPTLLECTEEEAKAYCDRKFKGPYPFFGERYTEDAMDRSISRAERSA